MLTILHYLDASLYIDRVRDRVALYSSPIKQELIKAFGRVLKEPILPEDVTDTIQTSIKDLVSLSHFKKHPVPLTICTETFMDLNEYKLRRGSAKNLTY